MASDGTLWRSAWAALLHDLAELKWKRLLPTLQDPAVTTKTRCDLRLSQAELAKAAGISESLLARIERRERRCTKSVAEELWRAMWVLKRPRSTPFHPELSCFSGWKLPSGFWLGMT